MPPVYSDSRASLKYLSRLSGPEKDSPKGRDGRNVTADFAQMKRETLDKGLDSIDTQRSLERDSQEGTLRIEAKNVV